MFWADKLLEGRPGKEWINDSWTPSGMVHMGGLKGPLIHDVLYSLVKKQGREVKFTFGFDDADPIDGLPPELTKSHKKYMGVPIHIAPSPDGNGSFGDYFGRKMRRFFHELGINAEIYLTSEQYKKGVYNDAITYVLDRAQEIRNVYLEMYHKPIANDWYPVQVLCPSCRKLGTTRVFHWDKKEVTFLCEPYLVEWAQGCGYTGKISPYNGNAKMLFKIEWAAKWWTFGVTIEGAGKDHASKGGTYDVARKIIKDVFHQEPPLWLPYEHFLYNGKKMSSSKGIGLNAEQLLEVLPPEIVRFLMIKTSPNQAIEFNPNGTLIIPKLFDEYQKAADAYFSKTDKDLARSFELSQIGIIQKPPTIRFSVLAQWAQMPNMYDLIKKESLGEWAKYARIWIEKYAPETEKFLVQKNLPEAARKISEKQKEFLLKIKEDVEKKWEPEEFQKHIYDVSKQVGILSKEAFGAIYLSLIGKDHGPKAGWLILSLDKEFVKKRFEEVSSSVSLRAERSNLNGIAASPAFGEASRNDRLNKPEIFSIDKNLAEKFPSISVGIAVIKNVSIQKTSPELEKEKNELLKSFENLTTEQLVQYPEIQSYRKLYKATGVDWHSRRPSPEALLRRVALKKGLYNVNICVDAYNLIVMKHRISIGAFDLDKIQFPTILRFAKSSEDIHLLGDQELTKYKDGEIAYFDQKGGFNMDFNYRDAQRTVIQFKTKNIYLNVDGVFDITSQKVEEVLKETCEKILKYCGGNIELIGVATSS